MTRLILASASATRQQLLRSAGLRFDVRVATLDEEAIQGQTPLETAQLRAFAKAGAVRAEQDEVIVAADQVLDFEGEALGKMPSATAAADLLTRLSGKTHTLHSAVTVHCPSQHWSTSFVVSTHLTMRPLTSGEISAYVASNEWQGCAGSYRIEGRGVLLFSKIEGCYFNILGLPLTELISALSRHGVDVWALSS